MREYKLLQVEVTIIPKNNYCSSLYKIRIHPLKQLILSVLDINFLSISLSKQLTH